MGSLWAVLGLGRPHGWVEQHRASPDRLNSDLALVRERKKRS